MRIWIDINAMGSELKKLSDNVNAIRSIITREVVMEIYREWVKQASLVLNKTADDYINSLSINQISDFVYEVGIDDPDSLAAKLEGGSTSFDMKVGFRGSDKVKRTKSGGWYLTIPFTLGTPGANPKNFSNIMPRSVYNAVKDAFKNNREIELPPKYDVLSKPHHKSPIFEGINRTSNSKGGHSYNTFRRVSDKSDPRSWIHPGFKSYNIMQRVVAQLDVNQIVKDIITNNLK